MDPGALPILSASKHGGHISAIFTIAVVEVGEGVKILFVAVEGRLAGRGWWERGKVANGLENQCVIHGSDTGALLTLQTGSVTR